MSKLSQIHVAIFRPGKEPTFEDITNDLPTLQKIVGGYIEMLSISKTLILICNEEGKLDGLERNRYLSRVPTNTERREKGLALWLDMLTGTFFVCRRRGAEFASLKPDDEPILKGWGPGTVWDLGGTV